MQNPYKKLVNTQEGAKDDFKKWKVIIYFWNRDSIKMLV